MLIQAPKPLHGYLKLLLKVKILNSMRDRLRSVQCPSDIADQIVGWTTDGVGQGYSSGYRLDALQEWMEKAILHFGQYSDAAR